MIYIDRKYVALLSSQLNLFKKKSTDLYVFRCPICGDSEKNKLKARGYVYADPKKNALRYKCHNCGDSRYFGNLLKAIDLTLYSEYTVEKYASKHKPVVTPKTPTFKAPVFQQDTPLKRLSKLVSVRSIADLPEDHLAIDYLKQRQIPQDKWGHLFVTLDDHELERLHIKYRGRIPTHETRLLIPTTDGQGRLTGLNGRSLCGSKLRYLNIKLVPDEEAMVYGLDVWDSTKYTYVTEGAIDSMFLPNALAVGGSDFGKIGDIIDKHNSTIIFDNEPRNKEIHRGMRKVIAAGYSICIWPDKIKEKDINEMHLNGLVDIQRIIDTHTFKGLDAELRLQDWSKT